MAKGRERPAGRSGEGAASSAPDARRIALPENGSSEGRRAASARGIPSDVLQIAELGPARPPCSVAELQAAEALARSMKRTGLEPKAERLRAPTSPTWVPLLRALARLWAAAFLAASWPAITIGLAIFAAVSGFSPIAGLVRFVPLLGARTRNVVAVRKGRSADARPIVAFAHLDSHPTSGAPLHTAHVAVAALSGWLILAAGIVVRRTGAGWRAAAGVVAAEAVCTLVWLAWRELTRPIDVPDDNTSGLLALARIADQLSDGMHAHDVWLVGTAGGTSGSYGAISFLRRHRDLRDAWVIELDALGSGEIVASPVPTRFPYPGTPNVLVRGLLAAAGEINDPLTTRRVRRTHSDARAATRRRVAAISLTAGLSPPATGRGPDPANAERAARIVDSLVRLDV